MHGSKERNPMASRDLNVGDFLPSELRLVHCTYCNKTHSVKPDETPCAPGAWLDSKLVPGLAYRYLCPHDAGAGSR